jgi:hypothetical protein
MINIDNQMALNAYNNLQTSKIMDKNLNKADTKDQTKQDMLLKEQTDAFEAFMVKAVLDVAIKNENSLFGKDAADGIYNSMYNDTMSRALSGNLGFSQLLYDFLKQRG